MDDPKTNPLLADPTSPNTKEGVCGPLPPIPEEGPHLRPRPEASEDGLQPAHNLLLTTMFTFQFFHWFKPSQAFFADYVLPRYHITNHQLVTEVYAWDTLFQILAAGFTVLVFVGLGLRHALTICAVAAACTVVAVLFFDSLFFLLLSQALWALSFCALFLVPSILYRQMPPAHFQTASSINNCAMLLASLSASMVGFLISESDPSLVCSDSTRSSSYKFTFYISLGSALMSLLVAGAGFYNDWIPAACKHSYEPRDLLFQVRANLKASRLLLWLCVSAVTRGVHTQVTTLWPLISYEISSDCYQQRWNALISFAAYLGAAIAVLIPARYPQKTKQWGRFVVAPGCLLGGLLLLALGAAHSLWQLGIILLVYHSVSELMLTIASAHIAYAALEASQLPMLMGMQYMSAMAAKYIGSLLVQLVTQLTIWPQLGTLQNVFGLHLEVRTQIQALGLPLCAVFAVAVVIHCKELSSYFTRSCADYEHVSSGH